MREPLVSVLIPVYNAGKYFRYSVESICKQSHSNLEIIVIDDGSTDGCVEKSRNLKDPRVVVLRQRNLGKPVALNWGLSVLNGVFYVVQDADDISYAERIERQVAAMNKNPKAAAVFTGYDLILGQRRCAPRFSGKDMDSCRHDIENVRMPTHDPTGMYRLSYVRGMEYDKSLAGVEGLDYVLRVGELYPMIVLGECLYSYRIHAGSVTRRNTEERKEKVKRAQEKALRRRGELCTVTRVEKERYESEHGVVTHFMESVLDLKKARRRREAYVVALQCWRLHWNCVSYYKPGIYAILPLYFIKLYRQIKGYLIYW